MNHADVKFSQTIRKAKPDDIDGIFKIEQRCFEGPNAYSRRQLEYLALKANSTCLVETQGETLRGFIIVTYRNGGHTANIETIDVEPAYQKKGVGIRLLTAAENDMKNHGMATSQLEVSEGNAAALRLYQKAGYVFKEKLSNYYHYEDNGTRDAVRLIKSLQ